MSGISGFFGRLWFRLTHSVNDYGKDIAIKIISARNEKTPDARAAQIKTIASEIFKNQWDFKVSLYRAETIKTPRIDIIVDDRSPSTMSQYHSLAELTNEVACHVLRGWATDEQKQSLTQTTDRTAELDIVKQVTAALTDVPHKLDAMNGALLTRIDSIRESMKDLGVFDFLESRKSNKKIQKLETRIAGIKILKTLNTMPKDFSWGKTIRSPETDSPTGDGISSDKSSISTES